MIDTIEIEWKWYKEEMSNDKNDNNELSYKNNLIEQRVIHFCREVVFTHMDCQSLNILTPVSSTTTSSPPSSSTTTSTKSTKCHNEEHDFDNDHPDIEELSDNSSNVSSISSSNNNNNNDQYYHNDESFAPIKIIDYEYSSFNRRVVDIANTFLEYCDMNNLKPNYEKEYPTIEEQNLFLSTYLHQCYLKYCEKEKEDVNEGKIRTCTPSVLLLRQLFESSDEDGGNYNDDTIVDLDTVLDIMREEITKHTLFSHLEWTCWSIIQSMICDIEFDYIKYAKLRMEGYFYFKKLCWNKE